MTDVNSNCSVFSFDKVQLGPGTGRKTSEMVEDLMMPLSNTYVQTRMQIDEIYVLICRCTVQIRDFGKKSIITR